MSGSVDAVKRRLQLEMEERLGDGNRYLLSLYETMFGLINHLDMNELLTALIHRAAEMVATQHAFIYLVQANGEWMEMILGIGIFDGFRFRVRRGEGMVGRVWESGEPLMVNGYCNWEGRVRHPFFNDVKAAIVVPLVSGGEVIGVIGLDYCEESRRFDETQVAMLSRFAELASLVLENAQAYSGVKQELDLREQELSRLQQMLAQAMGISRVGIFSDVMQQIVGLAQKYHENRNLPVLIEGETGTGKELVAKTIHFGDMKNPGPFIDINCAAIPANLFESELYGYEAGAFTGALRQGQKGKFDLARGGTLFLDEISEIPLELQVKLLRVIQEKDFFRVGGLHKVRTDVRIICATNVDLAECVAAGKFRKDLYYRLKVGHIFVPPLRARREEIIPLAMMFLQEFAAAKGKRFSRISAAAERLLTAYEWPGNVRELRNIIEWIVALYDDLELKPGHLTMLRTLQAGEGEPPAVLRPADFALPAEKFSLEDFVDRIVLQAVAMNGGNKSAAAEYLGISRRSIYYRLERLQDRRRHVK
jgi:transcriptional regulator with GAF, ATPase, and Fis domain